MRRERGPTAAKGVTFFTVSPTTPPTSASAAAYHAAMVSPDPQALARQRLLGKYRVVASPHVPPLAAADHLNLIAVILLAFDGQALRTAGVSAACAELCRQYDRYAARLPQEIAVADTHVRLRIACTAGCSHCCLAPVTVIAPEAVAIAEYIDTTFSAEQKLALALRLASYHVPPEERGAPDSMCPLNVEGLCSVYEVRPFNCRRFHSLDLQACLRFFRARTGDLAEVLQEPYRMDRFGVFWHSADVAFTALGIDTRDLDFIPALTIAIAEPGAEQLFASDSAFAAAAHYSDE